MMYLFRLTAALLAPCLVAGCAVGPNFLPPDPGLPATSLLAGSGVAKTAAETEPVDPTWWTRFRDPILTRLEARIAAENLDVRTATIRLAESRFQRGVAAAAEFPSLSGNGKYTREQYSQNGIVSLLGSALGGGSGAAINVPPINDYTLSIDASWEIDIWGRVRRQIEAADAQVTSTAEQRRGVLISNLAELARDYIQLRGAQAQLRITRDNLKIGQEILDLTQTRQQKGLTTGLDAENAAALVESVRAELPMLEQQEVQAINALSLLLDMPPGALRSELATARPVPPAPAHVPLGIPSELARRRPDIRQAEADLHAATATIGVAVGDFYPKLQFNGTVGLDALEFKNLWKPSSLQYQFGPSLTIPIFQGGRLVSTLELREAQQQEAAITYEKTVLQAWHEVVNALVAYRKERERRARLASQVDHARRALELARARYNDGVADFIAVLDPERTLLQAEQQYVTSTTNVSLDLVQLYKALGGGWELDFPPPPPVPEPVLVPAPTEVVLSR